MPSYILTAERTYEPMVFFIRNQGFVQATAARHSLRPPLSDSTSRCTATSGSNWSTCLLVR